MREVKQPEVRKSEIVATALKLFTDSGYEKTTVAAIIGELGVAKGCFYHHFRSKDEVFEACVRTVVQQILDASLASLEDRSVSPAARLMAYVDYSYRQATDAASSGLLRDLYSHNFADIHSRVTAQVAADLLPAMTALVDEGTAAGEFHITDARFTAVAVLGALQGIHEAYAGITDLDFNEHRRQLIELLRRILAAQFA